MLAIMVGSPFEEQTLYGPFNNFDEADDFVSTVRNEYSWVVELVPVPAKERIEP